MYPGRILMYSNTNPGYTQNTLRIHCSILHHHHGVSGYVAHVRIRLRIRQDTSRYSHDMYPVVRFQAVARFLPDFRDDWRWGGEGGCTVALVDGWGFSFPVEAARRL